MDLHIGASVSLNCAITSYNNYQNNINNKPCCLYY